MNPAQQTIIDFIAVVNVMSPADRATASQQIIVVLLDLYAWAYPPVVPAVKKP